MKIITKIFIGIGAILLLFLVIIPNLPLKYTISKVNSFADFTKVCKDTYGSLIDDTCICHLQSDRTYKEVQNSHWLGCAWIDQHQAEEWCEKEQELISTLDWNYGRCSPNA